MVKNTFTIDELKSLSAEEIIEKIQNENYSLLTTLGADKLRKEMVPVGKACRAAVAYFLNVKPKDNSRAHSYNARAKLVKTLKKVAPANYKAADFPTDSKKGLVIGFNHPSLGEILRLVMMKVDILGEKPMLFPVNLPWYESMAKDYERLLQLGIIITPTITPATWKKMNLPKDTEIYEVANKIKHDFKELYIKLSEKNVQNGGVIFVAPSATRQATVFKNKAVYKKQEEIIPTMSVLALQLYKRPKMDCDFLPVAIVPPEGFKRGLNLGKSYSLKPAKLMTADKIRKKYFKTKNPKRLENFDYDFHQALAKKLPKQFWY